MYFDIINLVGLIIGLLLMGIGLGVWIERKGREEEEENK